jgi:hypothetical protein
MMSWSTKKGANTQALAQQESCSARTVRLTRSLAFLTPKVVKAKAKGKLPRGLGFTRLTASPAYWAEQHRMENEVFKEWVVEPGGIEPPTS